jgi:hypothetical protein
MNIKFIVDKFKEQDRRQLELIKKIISEKPSKSYQDAKFLRRFTLAILHHYNKNLNKESYEERLIDLPHAPSKIKLDFKVPQAPFPLKLDIKLEPLKKLEL